LGGSSEKGRFRWWYGKKKTIRHKRGEEKGGKRVSLERSFERTTKEIPDNGEASKGERGRGFQRADKTAVWASGLVNVKERLSIEGDELKGNGLGEAG